MADLITAGIGFVGVLAGGYLTHRTQMRALRDAQANDRRTREADIVGELASASITWISMIGNKILDAENHARGIGNMEYTAQAMERWEADSRTFTSALARVRCGTLNPGLRDPLKKIWVIWHDATTLVNSAYLDADEIRNHRKTMDSFKGATRFETIKSYRADIVTAIDELSGASRAWGGYIEAKRPWSKRVFGRGRAMEATSSQHGA
ncbi:hypothetical protein [Glycomyces tenuis]|uniref:hypothetical protein n=1 Tax=Glycomyces tenuis TaxID=58116 RepID=UPI00047E0FE5|nr:hypothetical protein [Glycomyces tenuis]